MTELPDIVYFIPCPKSPHGLMWIQRGEYIVGSGKLAATMPVFSFTKFKNAIAKKEFEGDFNGIPVIKYESALHGEVKKPGLGPLHTEFDEKGNAYTSMFVSSEIVKWNVKTLEILDQGTDLLFNWSLKCYGRSNIETSWQIYDRLQQNHKRSLSANRP